MLFYFQIKTSDHKRITFDELGLANFKIPKKHQVRVLPFMSYAVLAFYYLKPISSPHEEVLRWKKNLALFNAKGRIYIGEQGINSQMSLPFERLDDFKNWLHEHENYREIAIKVHQWDQHAFEKLIVKYRKQIVAFDTDVDFTKVATPMNASDWKAAIEENDPNTVILDVRNQYEYDIGHFKGALAPECDSFRDYHSFIEKFTKDHDPKKTRVMMYCTGGIRCEFFSPYLKEKGFENLFQLHGGVIQYGLDVGAKYWDGKLFVFDDRMAIPISDEPSTCISHCKNCQTPNDDLYNCANTDCNNMFTCCPSCVQTLKGCCSEKCTHSPRLRPLEHQNPHKPFRKWHLYRDAVAQA